MQKQLWTCLSTLGLLGCAQPIPSAPCEATTATTHGPLEPLDTLPGRSEAALAQLNRLRSVHPDAQERFVVGQNIGHTDYRLDEAFEAYGAPLEPLGGVGILAIDYGYGLDVAQFRAANDRVMTHADRGGWVSVSTHAGNPLTGRAIDHRRYDAASFDDLLVEGTPAHAAYRESLDTLAQGLADLRDRGVIVLWRPLHEPNGSWFWYSTNREGTWTEPAAYQALWRDMHTLFTDEYGLDNLLWVFAPNAQLDDKIRATDAYYPGDDLVDIVGVDIYQNRLDGIDRCGSYTRLAALDKPIGLTEVGPGKSDPPGQTWDVIQVLDAADTYERLSFGVFWHGWLGRRDQAQALIEFDGAEAFLDDPRVLAPEAL